MIGRTIGNYTITSKLGEGGMGIVYVARHPRIGRKVAIKTLLPQYGKVPDVVRRFFNEAKAAHEIKDPHIVDVLDFGELEDGTSYFIMELLEGQSLREALERQPVFSLARAAHIADGILKALTAAHARGVVHRDLKPDNVFLVKHDGDPDFVKVLDFGIAKLTGGGENDAQMTGTGMVMGTPAFMSPEQCRGRKDIDGRADVYSLGIILYRMVTGRLPFDAATAADSIAAHLTAPPVPPRSVEPSLPPAVEEVILKSLEKEPHKRFESAIQFRRELQTALGRPLPVDETTLRTLAPTGEAAPQELRKTPGTGTLPGVGGSGGSSAAGGAVGEKRQITTLGGASSERTDHGTQSARRWPLLVGGLVVVAGIAVGVGTLRSPPKEASAPAPIPAAAPAPAPPAPIAPPPTVAAPPSMPAMAVTKVHVEATPGDAKLFLDGAPIPNPYDGKFERSDVGHRIEATAPGYRSEVKLVTFAEDRAVQLKLSRSVGPREPKAAAHAAPAAPATRKDGYQGTKGTLITDFPDK